MCDKEWLEEVRGEFETSVDNCRRAIQGSYKNTKTYYKWMGYLSKAQADRDKITELERELSEEHNDNIANSSNFKNTEEEFRELYRKKDADVFDRDREIGKLKALLLEAVPYIRADSGHHYSLKTQERKELLEKLKEMGLRCV